MDGLNEFFNVHPVTKKAIVCILAGILVFSLGFIGGNLSNIQTQLQGSGIIYDAVQQPQTPSTQQVQGGTQFDPSLQTSQPSQTSGQSTPPAETNAPADDTPAADAPITDAPATDAPVADAPAADTTESDTAPVTTAEILELFTKSANKIKADAIKVTRNYEHRQHNEEQTKMPPALQTIGSGLITTFLKDENTPVEYASTQEITEKYPVQGQNYVCRAEEGDIADASCDDDGTYYNITLKFHESVDPNEGEGCFSAFNCLKSEDITSAPGVSAILKSFSLKYYDAVITCKIEKSTGNMVSANYTLPMVLSVNAKVLFSELDAQVGMTFVDDYTIEY